ncbi:MAG TPA: DNA polymerase III subunit beta [Candidatus Paceibacterota bacterium]|nr:DNA polymerase III subunit beta [Candidatus Paceibacterota bacterium]
MKLIILKNNLVDALNAVEGSVGDNTNLPILKNILISAEDNKITLTSTNLEIAVKYIVPGKIVEGGSLTVIFSVFSNIVKNLSSERVTLEKDDKNLIVTTDNYEAVIRVQDPKDFPIIPSIQDRKKSIKIGLNTLKNTISRAIIAAQYSDVRPEISGVLVSLNDQKLKFVATDSFRLVEITLNPGDFETNIKELSVIVPLKAATEVVRSLTNKNGGEVLVFVESNQILFQTENENLISRLIDGTFPDYQAIVPKTAKSEAVASREELMNAVKITKIFSGRANDISLKVGENNKFIEVSATDSSLGENRYKIPIKLSGEKFSLSFNWRYLMDGLKIWEGEEVIMGVNEPGRPVSLRSLSDPNMLYIVMPVKS